MVSTQVLIFGFLLLTGATAGLTGWLIRFGDRSGMHDIPNSRSSHTAPTVRGGGLAIVLGSLAVWLALAIYGWLESWSAVALLAGGSLIALAGWIDDRRSLSARARLGIQFSASALMVASLGAHFQVGVTSAWTLPHGVSQIFAVLYLVWMTNLYNFMDGIDGIAASEAVTVALLFSILSALSGLPGISLAFAALAATSLGFLFYNWQPARVFMGDVGSGFLGFAFGALILIAEASSNRESWKFPVLGSLIALGIFIVDSGVTLVQRARRGQRLAVAHRSHAYQRATRMGLSHAQVTGGVIAINVLWLAPLVFATWAFPAWALGFTGISWIPLLGLVIYFNAGQSD